MGRKRYFPQVKRITFACGMDDFLALKEIANKKRIPISSLLRSLVRNYVNGYSQELLKQLTEASEDRVEVTFLRDYGHFRIGSMAVLPKSKAEELIQKGIVKLGEGFA